MLEKTSKPYAPWYVIPADKKFFAHVAVGDIILELFRSLDLHYPRQIHRKYLQKQKQT